MSENQLLYIISDGAGNVKVGVGANPRARLRQLQTGNARRLSLRRQTPFTGGNSVDVERYVHWMLKEHHVGGEWFSVDEHAALAALLAAGIAVIKGLRAPRPGFGGVGRPPKEMGRKMKQFTHWLDPDDMARVEAAVGKMKISEFIREAIDRELKRRERALPKREEKAIEASSER